MPYYKTLSAGGQSAFGKPSVFAGATPVGDAPGPWIEVAGDVSVNPDAPNEDRGVFLCCDERELLEWLSVACVGSHRPRYSSESSLCALVAPTNVASLRRKPFKQKGLAALSQQCHRSTQDSPVHRVDYLFFQGHQPGRDSVRECSERMKRQHR